MEALGKELTSRCYEVYGGLFAMQNFYKNDADKKKSFCKIKNFDKI